VLINLTIVSTQQLIDLQLTYGHQTENSTRL